MPAIAGGKKVSCLKCHGSHYVSLGNCMGCHRGDDRSDRIRIAHRDLIPARYAHFTLPGSLEVERGKKLIDLYACRRCHRTFVKGNRLAADLDRLFHTTPPQKIHDAIKFPAVYMPDFHFSDQQLDDIVNAIMAAGRRAVPEVVETPQVIHFAEKEGGRENPFVKNCGPCHKLMSQQFGGQGKGEIGPNLSGLFTEFYPATFHGKERWTEKRLRKWLENPRKLLSTSAMRPVLPEKEELEEIMRILK